MTPHDLMVIITGLIFVTTGLALGQTAIFLGPKYSGQITVGKPWRLFFSTLSGIAMLRGLSLLIPANVDTIKLMSVIMPMEAMAFLSLALVILNFVMADRAPPPLIERFMRMASVRLTDREIIDLALTMPPADYCPAREAETAQARRDRLWVLGVAGVLLVCTTLGIAARSPLLGS